MRSSTRNKKAEATELDWNFGALADGLRCYEREEFFLAHEHWESVWLTCSEPERSFVQALIQVAAAFHHLQRNNALGAQSLLRRALRKLQLCDAQFAGIDVDSLRAEIQAWLYALGVEGASVPPVFPEIRVSSCEPRSNIL